MTCDDIDKIHSKLGMRLASFVERIATDHGGGFHFNADRPYMNMIRDVMRYGVYSENRTGVDTIAHFGSQYRYNAGNLPILTTKKILTKSIVAELVWFLRGETNVKFLQNNDVHIWDEWADENGDLGPVYGSQWRNWDDCTKEVTFDGPGKKGLDQIAQLVDDIVKNPASRRHIVTAWNPREISQCKLPPCHVMWQIDVQPNGGMSLMLTQRSLDVFLGAPFNIVSYALLLHIICHEVNRRLGEKKYFPNEFIHSVANTHIYVNHIEQVWTQWRRDAKENIVEVDLTDFQINDPQIDNIKITGYDNFHPFIRGDVAV